MTRIPVHPHDSTFARLMKDAAKSLRTDDLKLLKRVKREIC